MAELKTKPTDVAVSDYIEGIENENRKSDCKEISAMMSEITGDEGKMWGASIAGYGSYKYKYASGHEGEWMLTGFSSRKQSLSIYIMSGFKKHNELVKKLGKFKTGKSCLYVNRLDDIDREVLRELITESVHHLANGNPPDYS